MANKCPSCHADNPETSRFCAGCGTPLPPPQSHPPVVTETLQTPIRELTTGSTFAGRYQVIEELGHGGMGKVYRVLDQKLDEEVALKLIKPEIALDKETIRRFHNELKLARKIAHRNVGKMYELMEDKGTHFITMEYVPGQDLRGLIRQMDQLTAGKALSIAEQVCAGLEEAHRQGVVHRDLKPGNILIDKEGNARIMDFGIARSLRGRGITGAGMMIGTPEYMSPEQVEGKDVDQRSDIYSLGVVLYEMLTGRVPFEGDTPFTIGVKHKSEIPRDPREINPQIPQGLGRLVLRCLEKDKAKRYQSAAELHADLGRVERGLPSTERVASAAKPATLKKITVEFTPKKLLIPAAALAALVIAAAFLWHPWTSSKTAAPVPKVENSVAVISFQNLTGDSRYDSLIKAVPNLMITKLESMGIPYVASWERLQDLLKQMGKESDAAIDKEIGFEICRREGIAVLITGEVTRAGNIFVTNLKALAAGTKASLASASAQGQGEESILLSQIDELAGRVHLKLGWNLPGSEAAAPVTEFTTASMEAYKYFIMGQKNLDKMYREDALKNLERAVALDPQFAMAYLYLYRVHRSLNNFQQSTEALEKAKAFSGKATEKERMYIEAAYARRLEKDTDKELRILQDIAAKYPREKEVHSSLFAVFQQRKMYPEAIAEANKALELNPKWATILNQLGFMYIATGDLGKAEEYLKKAVSVAPDDANPLDSLGELYFLTGRLDEAIAQYREAVRIKPNFGSEDIIAYIYAVKGDYAEAMSCLDQFILAAPSKSSQSLGYWWKAIYHHVLGKRKQAIVEMDRVRATWELIGDKNGSALARLLQAFFYFERSEFDAAMTQLSEYNKDAKEALSQPDRINAIENDLWLGLLAWKQGRIETAKQNLEHIRLLFSEMPEERGGLAAQLEKNFKILQAEVWLSEGKGTEAINFLENEFALQIPLIYPAYARVFTWYNFPLDQDVLPRAYQKTGKLDKAIEEYRILLVFDPKSQDRRLHNPVYHYRLAKLYEQKGLMRDAKKEYERFLDLWKEADPGLPEVEDAWKRLAGLKGN
jgi:serine/threonine protein kinase/tetratricopeptide (TPR) repeat protein